MHWNYRLVRHQGRVFLAEVYYPELVREQDEPGWMFCEARLEAVVGGDYYDSEEEGIRETRWALESMLLAFEKPILRAVPNPDNSELVSYMVEELSV